LVSTFWNPTKGIESFYFFYPSFFFLVFEPNKGN